MNKTIETTTAIVPARPKTRSLLNDIKGANEVIQNLILVVCLALASIGAVKALSGKVNKASDDAGKRIETEVK
jgi:hypothetical protein